MDQALQDKLINCLDALDNGESIEQVLARYPNEAMTLRPFLECATNLTTLKLQPTDAAQSASRARFLSQATTLRAEMSCNKRPSWRRPVRFLAPALLIISMCLAILNISASALPGDIFYDTKRFVERTQLYLPLGAEDLSEQFRQTRLSEIEALLRQNRDAPVMFTGEVDEIEASSWRIEGLIIDTAAATISPNVQVGDWVEVTGSVANGRLVADDIRLTSRSQPSPTPTSRPTSTSENDNNGRANNSSSSGSDDYRKND